RMGFKPVPIGSDSIPAVSSTNEIYNNPDYWTEEKLTQNYWKFSNRATTFGITYVRTIQGNKKLYLHCLDIDSDNVLAILFDLLNELKPKTFVTKTKKDCGYHVYWLSHIQHAPIGISRCKRGYEFEIKSDNSLGLCTLPPSVHRDDSSFRYRSMGSDRIAVDDQLYDKLLGMLSPICLNTADIVKDNQKGPDLKNDVRLFLCSPDAFRSLEESTIDGVVSALKDIYQRGHRNSIVFGLSGLLFKSHVSLISAQNIINKLCDCTNDEEKSSRLEVTNNTYLNGVDGHEVKGTSQLLETLTSVNEGNKDYARSILENITGIIGSKNGYGRDDNNNANQSIAELLIHLAKENALLFFKDQLHMPRSMYKDITK
ncbi:MAG: hypothetical protein WA364_20700, partial [Candidatus Nitrosopolaris sp.]